MDFLGAVNRVLTNAYIIKGDDDLLTNFNDSQHEATLRIAKNAIQTELNGLLSFFPLDYERSAMLGTLTTVVGQQTYDTPADFVRFWGDKPFLWQTADTADRMYEYEGGEKNLQQVNNDYRTDQGKETWWYWYQGTTKKIGLYLVPDAIRVWNYEYEKDSTISNSTDSLPFQSEAESQAFADMAARRFVYMVEKERDLVNLEQDSQYVMAQGTLMNFMRHRNPPKKYGQSYR